MNLMLKIPLLVLLVALIGGCPKTTDPITPPPEEKTPTSLQLSLSPASAKVGEPVVVEAQLRAADGTALAGKSVAFSVDGTPVDRVLTDQAGLAAIEFNPASAGEQRIGAEFAADVDFEASNASVTLRIRDNPPPPKKKATRVELTPLGVVYPGDNVVIRAKLFDADGVPVVARTIILSVDRKVLGRTWTDANGLASLVFAPASAGEKAVRAEFAEDADYLGSNASTSLRVENRPPPPRKLPTRVVLSLSRALVQTGETVSASAKLTASDGSPLAGKAVAISVDGKEIGRAQTDLAGEARIEFAPTSAGSKEVEAKFAGDARFLQSSASATLAVKGASALRLALPAESVQLGENFDIQAQLSDSSGRPLAGRTVIVSVDRQEIGRPRTDLAGRVRIAFAAKSVGNRSVSAKFLGDPTHTASSAAGTLRVERRPTQSATSLKLMLPETPVEPGKSVELRAKLSASDGSPLAGKPVAISIDGNEFGRADTNESGEISIDFAPTSNAGKLAVHAGFSGDADHLASSASGELALKSVKGGTSLKLTLPAEHLEPGQNVAIRAKLSASDGSPLAGKAVALSVDGNEIGSFETDESGAVSFEFALPSEADKLAVQAEFAGDADHLASSDSGELRLKGATSLELMLPAESQEPGKSVAIRAKLTASNGSPLVGKAVSISSNGNEIGSAETDESGEIAIDFVVPADAGELLFKAEFAGDAEYLASSASGELRFKARSSLELMLPAEPVESGQSIALRAQLTDAAGAPLSGKPVAISVDGNEIGNGQTDADGEFSVDYLATGTGNLAVQAEFAGDADHLASGASGALTVERPAPSGAAIYFNELVKETIYWEYPPHVSPRKVYDRIWALWRYDLETDEFTNLKTSRSWVREWIESNRYPKSSSGGSRSEPKVIDGKLYVDGSWSNSTGRSEASRGTSAKGPSSWSRRCSRKSTRRPASRSSPSASWQGCS